jgi:hypothetical protein
VVLPASSLLACGRAGADGLRRPRVLVQVGSGMGVLVERCRYLEEAGCASICINSCKVPTQVRGPRARPGARPWEERHS